MSQPTQRKDLLLLLERYFWSLAAIWTVLIATSFAWNALQAREWTLASARVQARVAHQKDLAYRTWNSMSRKVYVPQTEHTPPNPFLDGSDRDVETVTGERLTLVNPSYMNRRVHELERTAYGVRGHITSLRPIRPDNAPDPWEAKALRVLESGESEFSEVQEMAGIEYMRLMRPLFTETACLRCHLERDFEVGALRGGIGISIPLAPLWDILNLQLWMLALGYGLVWIGGLALTFFGRRRLLESEQERRRTQEAIQRQKEFLTDVIESLSHPFLVIDADTFAIKMANRAAGFVPADSRNTCHGLSHHKDVPCDGADHVCPLEEVKRKKQPVVVEHTHYDRDGLPITVEVHGCPIFDDEGNVVQMIESCVDVSARKRMEEQLRVAKEEAEAASFAKSQHLASILENTSDMIVTSDQQGNIVSFNRGAELILGYDRQEVIGRPAWILFEDAMERERLIERAREEGSVSGCHARYLHKNGQRAVDIHVTLSQLRDEAGAPTGFVGIGRDVSEQQRLQAALIQSEKMAAMGKLAASIAHEINNPLTGILTFAEELMEGATPDDAVRGDYEMIVREALRCRGIVRDLLDYTRLEKPKRERVNIDKVVERSHGLIKGQAQFRDVEFELGFAANLPDVQVDVGQMRQVFLNLIINAGDAMELRGTIHIHSALSDDGRFVEVSVRDTGCGIAPELLDRIFFPFYSTKGQQGNGLGLNVVQSIVMQHGGTIRVESEVGVGATFVVSLPAVMDNGQPC